MESRQSLDTLLLDIIPTLLGYMTTSIEKIGGLLTALMRLSRPGRAALCFETLDMRMILEKMVSSMAFQIESAEAQIELGRSI